MTRIRERDGRCCITDQLVIGEDYTGFEAAYIFPLSETNVVRFRSIVFTLTFKFDLTTTQSGMI